MLSMIAPPLPEPFPVVFVDPPVDADDDEEAPCLSLSDLPALFLLLLLFGLSPFPALVLEPFVVLARFLGRSSSDFVVNTSDDNCLRVWVRFLLASAKARVSSLGL